MCLLKRGLPVNFLCLGNWGHRASVFKLIKQLLNEPMLFNNLCPSLPASTCNFTANM